MELKEFANTYHVKMTVGKQSTEDLVLGKFGEIAGPYMERGQMRLRLLAVPRDKDTGNKALNARKQEAKTGGLIPLHVSEDSYESIWGFPAENKRMAELAINLVHPRRRKVMPPMTEERKASLIATLALARQKRSLAVV